MPRIHDIMSGKDRSVGGHLARFGLLCLEPFYRGIVGVRNAMFDLGFRKPKRLPRPVISVGNITTGGTGKTPMVIEIVRRLLAMGQKPAVLLRGYKPSAVDEAFQIIDETNELETQINHGRCCRKVRRDENGNRTVLFDEWDEWEVPIRPQPSRYKAGLDVIDLTPEVTCFVLDDGFQHRQLHRDLNLVLIDAMEPFGYRHVLPRGMQREGLSRLKQADGIIITRADRVDATRIDAIDRRIKAITSQPSIAHAAHQWTGFDIYAHHLIEKADYEVPESAPRARRVPLDALRDKRVIAACGIGNPESFRSMLTEHVGELAHLHVFPDHHAYSKEDVRRLAEDMKQRGAAAIVITPKDYVKWMRYLPPFAPREWETFNPKQSVPVIYRPQMGMTFLAGEDKLDALLKKTLAG